ncbi:heterokaryon incompatibility protein-domain-containing protein [Phaeosphaeria sp. MPI-PUGE-AT-0046c]|nr:heterokaryon incompatibility protein-domain-containing protein [Phaeosphaeria sp. MPI-PUGE-AT-0046c]
MTAPLAYKELQTNEIRLIELLPNRSGAQVECRLFTVSLDNVPSYEALSYVWGDASVTRTITCDERAMEVTLSLATALERLRNSEGGSSRFIWADALSIDQSNMAEKNVQVPLMGQIYSSALGVLVYLGLEETESVKTAIAALEYVHSACVKLREAAVDPLDHLKFSDLETHVQELGFNSVWGHLNSFFTIPYWERVWCVQELNLAQQASFIVGSREIPTSFVNDFSPWYAARFVLEIGNGASIDVNLKPGTAIRASTMRNLSKWATQLHSKDLCPTLAMFQYARATDLRDKVYGLLGVYANLSGTKAAIEVDYKKTVGQVYAETAILSMAMTRSLDVLSYVEHAGQYSTESEYPSWVPRWDRATPLGYVKLLDSNTTISAGRNEATISSLSSAHTGVLDVQGIIFDQAFRASNILPGVSWLERYRGFQALFAQLWFEINGSSTTEHHLSDVELAMTLTGGFSTFDKETGRYGKDEDLSDTLEIPDSDRGRRFMTCFYSFVRKLGLPDFKNDAAHDDSEPYSMRAGVMCGSRRIFRTFGGCLGLGPGCMEAGDLVVVLDGGKVPYVLRPLGGPKYAFMGECFVYAIRNGEACAMAEKYGLPKQKFELV